MERGQAWMALRGGAPPPLVGRWVPSRAAMDGVLASQQGRTLLAADLCQGSWQAGHASAAFLRQLGAEPPPPLATAGSAGLEAYGKLVSAGVDREALGDGPSLSGHRDACAVYSRLQKLPGPCTLLIVCGTEPWAADDRVFVERLAHALGQGPHRLLLLASGVVRLPESWRCQFEPVAQSAPEPAPCSDVHPVVALFPDVLGPEDLAPFGLSAAQLEASTVPLGLAPAGVAYHLVLPHLRRASAAAHHYDRLASLFAEPSWLQAYAQCRGSNYFVEAPRLACEAWRQFASGAGPLATRLMDRAEQCASDPGQAAAIGVQAMALRIPLTRYAELADAALVDAPAPAAMRSFAHQAKGWGLIMTGRVEAALEQLRQAAALHALSPGSAEQLYYWNILALATFRSGDADGALALQERIRQGLSETDPQWVDEALRYINCINTARLHRQAGRHDDSERCYRQAFATVRGVASDSDLVYEPACLAVLDGIRGRTAESQLHWLRAGLYLASSNHPEAMAPRAAAMITQRRGASSADQLAMAIVEQLSTREDRGAGPDGFGPPHMVRAQDLPAGALAEGRAVHTPAGTLVLLSGVHPSATDTGGGRALRGGLWAGLCELRPDLRRARVGTLVVDDRQGLGMAQSRAQGLAMCLLRGVPAWAQVSGDLALTNEVQQQLRDGLAVFLGPAVQRVDAHRAYLRRYRAPVALDGRERMLLERCSREPGVCWAQLRNASGLVDGWPSVMRLWQQRVVDLALSEEACLAAGAS